MMAPSYHPSKSKKSKSTALAVPAKRSVEASVERSFMVEKDGRMAEMNEAFDVGLGGI